MVISEVHIRRFKGIKDIHLDNFGNVNAFYGRNNSGKSTILHALDMAGLALTTKNWNAFQLKLQIEDLFHKAGPFEMGLTYSDGSFVTIRQQKGGTGPTFDPQPTEEQSFGSVYIVPDPGIGILRRQNRTPRDIMNQVDNRNFSTVNGLEILYALKYYAHRNERGFQPNDYECIINDVKRFFPEVEDIVSNLNEDNVATLEYREYGRTFDVVYAGTGIKHFVDIFVKATLSKASVVLIDEPEMGLHPSLQRELLTHFSELVEDKKMQFFIATHSPVFLADPDKVTVFCVQNRSGERSACSIPRESLHTMWGDFGFRPGDLLQNDIVLMVEGQSDVIFFEDVIHRLYQKEFKNVAVGVVQYGGSAAAGIIKGKINVSNIVSGHTYRLWIRDRDAPPDDKPSRDSTKFKNALERGDEICHILDKREVEFYIPEAACVAAQQGDQDKEIAIKELLHGKQDEKFKDSASPYGCAVPRGTNLQKLLQEHLYKENLDPELKGLIEEKLIPWRDDILGDSRGST